LYVPTVSELVDRLAFPRARVAVPSCFVATSEKVTVAVGVPLPDRGFTIAVNLTFDPTTDDLEEVLKTVVVAFADTTDVVASTTDLGTSEFHAPSVAML
jgi:hypothetical protein